MREALPLLVALLALLAGCATLGGGPTPTVTPADVQVGDAYPPGVSERGVVFPATLARAHTERVNGTSYTLVSNRTVRYGNGSLRSELSIRVELAANRTYHATARTAGPHAPVFLGEPPATAEFWSDGDRYLRAFGRENRTYNEFSPVDDYVGTWRYWTRTAAFGGQAGYAEGTIRTVFEAVPTRVVNRSTVDGTTRLRLADTGEGGGRVDTLSPGLDGVRNLSLAAEVDATGVVRLIDLRYEATVDGEPVVVRRTIAYRAVGSTEVRRPSWFDRAVDSEA